MDRAQGVAELRRLYKELDAKQRLVDDAKKQRNTELRTLKLRYETEKNEHRDQYERKSSGLYMAREVVGKRADVLEEDIFKAWPPPSLEGVNGPPFTGYTVCVDDRSRASARDTTFWKARATWNTAAKEGWRTRKRVRRREGMERACFHVLEATAPSSVLERDSELEGAAIREHIEGLHIVGEEDAALDYEGVRCDRDPRPGGRRDPRTKGTLYELCQRYIRRHSTDVLLSLCQDETLRDHLLPSHSIQQK